MPRASDLLTLRVSGSHGASNAAGGLPLGFDLQVEADVAGLGAPADGLAQELDHGAGEDGLGFPQGVHVPVGVEVPWVGIRQEGSPAANYAVQTTSATLRPFSSRTGSAWTEQV